MTKFFLLRPGTAAIALVAAIIASSTVIRAQPSVKGQAGGDHPAVAVVLEFLDNSLKRNWTASTKLIEAKSLADVQRGWVAKAKQAPTIADEKRMVQSVGKNSLEEVELMPPAEFYGAYHRALQERFNMTDARLKVIADTISLRILSVAEEGPEVVHILVRTKHEDQGNLVSNLELISLEKVGGAWLVSLDQQGPLITPLGEAKKKQAE